MGEQPEVCLHRPLLELMERLVTVLPKGMDKFGFFTTGGEVVEVRTPRTTQAPPTRHQLDCCLNAGSRR